MSFFSEQNKRTILGMLVFVFIFQFVAVIAVVEPKPVYAQGAPDVVAELRTEAVQQKIELRWTTVAKVAAFQAIVNALSFFTQRFAYEMAMWVATGDSGQKPLLFTDQWGEYLGDVAGHAIGSFSQSLDIPGLDLCNPDLSLVLRIQLGIWSKYDKPEPLCSWKQLSGSYEAFFSQEGYEKVLSQSGVAFEPGQAPLSVALRVNRYSFEKANAATNAAINERLEGQGFKAVTNWITGNVETPSQAVKKNFDEQMSDNKDVNKFSVQAAFANTDLWAGIGNVAISTFLNTVASVWLERIMGGFFALGGPDDEPIFNPQAASGGSRRHAEQLYSELTVASIRSVDSYDFLSDFTTCPPNRGPMHCVMDEQFAAAVRQAAAGQPMTVQEAIDQGLLKGDWPLIPPTSVGFNQDQYCYTYGYCYSNLVKLRRARVIPIGWELAAKSSANSPGLPVTLQQAINSFHKCNEDGEADEAYPYCHLVDPNWVLKYPVTQCRKFTPGPTLIDAGGDRRIEICVDAPSCNSEDANGNCVGGWGYCTREKNVWRFDGDACPNYFATCESFTGATGTELSLRTNTLDYGICSVDNAGCRWYSTSPDSEDPEILWDENSRLYVNRRAPFCDQAAAGCTELVPKKTGVTLNIIRNASFEDDRLEPVGLPDFWDGAATYSENENAENGSDAVKMTVAQSLVQRIPVDPNRFYTMSFFAKSAGATGNVELKVDLKTSTGGNASMDRYFVGPGCVKAGSVVRTSLAATDEYGRQSCTFTAPGDAAYLYLTVSVPSGTAWVDGIQLEESEFATTFGEGYSGNGANQRTYLKVPPVGFCDGGDDDPAFCGSYAARCAPTEAGCEMYTPASGDPAIPGIARPEDQCPASCVGYETFREEPTNFNPGGEFPEYFIPKSARACSRLSAGCDEFTNLEAGAAAENREYYTFLRLCEETTAPDDAGTFYTWEGSDESGFQLRVWNLKLSNPGSGNVTTDPTGGVAPCTDYNAQGSSCDDPVAFVPPESCNDSVDIFLNPDCREFYDEEGNIHYRLFSKTVIKTDDCTDFRKTFSAADDCRDSGGRWQDSSEQCFYRAYVPDSSVCQMQENLCRLYTGNAGRNVQLIFEDDFEDGDTVGWTGGAISNESLAATGQSMRKIVGSRVVSIPMNEVKGETLLLSFWARGTANQPIEVKLTDASVARAFSVADADLATPTAMVTSDWRFYELGPVTVDWNYPDAGELMFTAAGELYLDNIRLKSVYDTIAVIRDSWQTPAVCDATPEGAYRAQEMLGCEKYTDRSGNILYLKSFSRLCREEAAGCEAFFDTHNSDSPYAETWNFICMRPDSGSGSCSIDPDGSGSAMSARVVCTIPPGEDRCTFHWDNELVDPDPTNLYASPILLPYIDNTGTATTRPFFYGPDLTVVPADNTTYLVNDTDKQCVPDEVGCTAVGAPTFNQSLTEVTGFAEDDLYLFNRPDEYGDQLCTDQALFCDAWRTGDGSEYYFKDPLSKTCEYRAPAIKSGTGEKFGWFRTGTDEPCYQDDPPDSYLYQVSGEEYGIWTNRTVCALGSPCTSSSGCNCPAGAVTPQCKVRQDASTCQPFNGWAGACEPKFAGCTEFRDPADPSGEPLPEYPGPEVVDVQGLLDFFAWVGTFIGETGASYTFIDNERLNPEYEPMQERCEGAASLREGCVLFNDASNPELTWNAGATYLKSDEKRGGRVSPVDCENPAAGDEKYCRTCMIGWMPSVNEYCVDNSDCQWPLICAGSQNVHYNTANRILNVRRDRECSEWLACDQSEEVFNPRTNNTEVVCSSLQLCDGPAETGSDMTSCIPVVDEPEPRVLTSTEYSSRDISWYGQEYSGYSIPDMYPVHTLRAVDVGACVESGSAAAEEGNLGILGPNDDPSNPGEPCVNDDNCADDEVCVSHFRLGHILGPCDDAQGIACQVGACSNNGRECASNANCVGGTCLISSGSPEGRCYSGQCTQTPNGTDDELASKSGPSMCRIYPEENSPFPNNVVYDDEEGWEQPPDTDPNDQYLYKPVSVRSGFQNAQLCALGESCECTYRKMTFEGGETRYYSSGTTGPGQGLCTSGKIGKECVADEECDVEGSERDGECSLRKRSDVFLGMPGFCLEYDQSMNINASEDQRACLTWFPVDRIAGAPDLLNQFADAGFAPAEGNEWYCAQGSWEAEGPSLREPELKIRYKDQNSWQFFGPPSHTDCNPGDEDEWGTNYSCISIRHISHDSDYNCEDSNSSDTYASWCVWPQRECDGAVWGGVSSHFSHNSGNLGLGTGGLCHSSADDAGPMFQGVINESGPTYEGGNNFLGCYEVADGNVDDDLDDWPQTTENGIGHIRYPWIGPDIYSWQVKEFEAHLLPSDSGHLDAYTGSDLPYRWNGLCNLWTGEDSDNFGDNPLLLKFYPDTNLDEPGQNLQLEGDDARMGMYPVWGPDNRLRAVTVIADDQQDELQFFVNEFIVRYWPVCLTAAHVGKTGFDAAYTDRVVGGHWEYPAPEGYSYDQNTAHFPWGAVNVPDEVSPSTVIVNEMEISDLDTGAVTELPIGGEAVPYQTDMFYRDVEGPDDEAAPIGASLKRFFARSNNVWSLDFALPGSTQIVDDDFPWEDFYGYFADGGSEWDETEYADGGSTKAPQIRAVDDCSFAGACNEEDGDDQRLTVNGQNFGDIGGRRSVRATLQFFAWADKNRMPLKRVAIDWGDQDEMTVAAGSFKNHRGDGVCEGDEFGKTSDTCDKRPFQVTHNYVCSEGILAELDECVVMDTMEGGRHVYAYRTNGVGGCRSNGRCVYKPRVMVKDNWGWCTGECPENPGLGGCYDSYGNRDATEPDQNECSEDLPKMDSPEKDPWVYYEGEILVEP